MIQKLFTIYLPAAAVLSIVTVAAVFLYQTNDPALEDVTFVGIAEDTEVESQRTQNVNEDAGDVEDVESLSALNTDKDAEIGIAANNEITEDAQGIASARGGSASGGESAEQKTEDAEKVAVEPTVALTVVTISGPGVSERCELELSEPETAHQVMKQAAQQCGFSYQWKKYASLGVFVDELAGVSSNNKKGKYWIYYVNGTTANVGVSSYLVASGDELLWKFEQEY